LTGKFQSVLVLNKAIPEISDMLGMEVHGILGADLFNRYAIHVNYKKQRLILMDPDALQPPLGYTEVPVEVSNNKGYIYAIIYNEWLQPQLVKLLVDCGASLAFLFNYNENKEEELYPYFSRYIESDVGIGLSGMIPGYIGRLFSAHIATHILNGIIISTVPFSDEAKNYFLNERDGLVGSEVLSKFNIWYNFPKQQMYIRPNSTFEKPFQYDMSGIIWTLQRSEEKQPVVKQVVDASPSASAGILPGDTLSTINGKAAESMSNADILQMLKSKAGKKINFVFLRGDERLKISIRLAPYI
jgi:membrane-associated protease RseP (regulator of RpoE activity)